MANLLSFAYVMLLTSNAFSSPLVERTPQKSTLIKPVSSHSTELVDNNPAITEPTLNSENISKNEASGEALYTIIGEEILEGQVIMDVPQLYVACEEGYQMDSSGNCREIFD